SSRRRHTRSKRDWSSDVCSSDLMLLVLPPPLYLLFVTVVVTGSSNAVNLTDGLDGLAAGLTAILAGTFAAFAYVFGRIDWTRYLLVYFVPGSQELTIFCGPLPGPAPGFQGL